MSDILVPFWVYLPYWQLRVWIPRIDNVIAQASKRRVKVHG